MASLSPTKPPPSSPFRAPESRQTHSSCLMAAFLALENKKWQPFSLLTIAGDGQVGSAALAARRFEMFDSFLNSDDLEGLGLAPAGIQCWQRRPPRATTKTSTGSTSRHWRSVLTSSVCCLHSATPCAKAGRLSPASRTSVPSSSRARAHGIRAMSCAPAIGESLVIHGPASRAPEQLDLWFWNGRRGASPKPAASDLNLVDQSAPVQVAVINAERLQS